MQNKEKKASVFAQYIVQTNVKGKILIIIHTQGYIDLSLVIRAMEGLVIYKERGS